MAPVNDGTEAEDGVVGGTRPKFSLSETNGGWQLQPRTPEAYLHAARKLSSDWIDGMQADMERTDIFLFTRPKQQLPSVLANLKAIGIAGDDIEIEQRRTE